MTLDRSQREFLAEAAEIVDHLNGGLSALDAERRRGPPNPARVNGLFRHAHSLKGLAGMFAVEAVSKVAHQMETLLDGLRLGRLEIDDALMEVLYHCTDVFGRVLTDVRDGRAVDEGAVSQLIKRLTDAAAPKAGGGEVALSGLRLPSAALAALTEYEEHRLRDNLKRRVAVYKVRAPMPLQTFDKDLASLTALLNELGEVITTLPSADESGDALIFDIVFASAADAGDIAARINVLGRYPVERVDDGGNATSPPRASAAVAPTQPPHVEDEQSVSSTVRQVSDTVRVDIRKLDELMGIVGELVLARGGLARITSELKAEAGYRGIAVDLHRLVRTLERRIADLQGAIMQVRMVPLGQVFDRMARTIRRVATSLGKEVELEVSGEDTELDKLIVEDLVDPLMHLVRNAVDHGLEPPDERLAAGKNPVGRLWLKAFPRGNHVIIEVVDDGRGIDEVAVKRAALERGVVDEETVGQLSRREVWNLIFAPGFSTRREVSEMSGRGVGLDVVKTNVARMSGLIDVESTQGYGTRFTVTLPITLAIIQACIIRSARRTYALPLASVLEIVAVQKQDVCRVEGREMLQLRGQTLPVIRLDRIFHSHEPAHAPEDGSLGYAAVVGLAQHRAALLIEDVVGQQDIVIKSLGAYLKKVRGIAGATHLGDHQAILVLDVASLVEDFLQADEPRRSAAWSSAPGA